MHREPPITLQKKGIWHNRLIVALTVLCVTQSLALFCLGGLWYKHSRRPPSLVVINRDDHFVAERAQQFDLPQVIQQYDEVISAIDRYHEDNRNYPPDLSALVPEYLAAVPAIYVRNGERLT